MECWYLGLDFQRNMVELLLFIYINEIIVNNGLLKKRVINTFLNIHRYIKKKIMKVVRKE